MHDASILAESSLHFDRLNRACRNWASLSSSEVAFMPEEARSASSELADAQHAGDIAAAGSCMLSSCPGT